MQTRGKGKDETTYLQLAFEEKALTIMVPLDSVDEVGIRRPSTKAEAQEILAILEESSDVPEAWAERNASTVSRVQSTEIAQAAMVIRDLSRHAQRIDKPLSTAERSTLEGCLDTVSLELSLSLGTSQAETRELILGKVGVDPDDIR
jgi:RNA polymerase-interacting CarD/CdnL/TRCF family regulator